MKSIFVFLVFVLISNIGFSQYFDNRRYWSEQELSIDDFLAEPIKNSPFDLELNYYTEYEFKKVKLDNITISKFVSSVYIDRSTSWMTKNAKNEKGLRYAQTIFNLAELFARKLETELNSQNNSLPIDYHTIYSNYTNMCHNTIFQFKQESEYGVIDSVVLRWYNQSKEDLLQNKRVEVPKFVERPLSLGYYFAGGLGVFHGEVKEYLYPHWDFIQMGYQVGYNRFQFDFLMNAGYTLAKKEFNNYSYSLDRDTATNLSFFDFSAGYLFIKNKKYSWYPFTGFTLMSMDRRDKYKKSLIEGPTRIQPNLGFNFNYYLPLNEVDQYTKYNAFLNFRMTYEPFYYTGKLNGGTINFLIGIGMTIQTIRFEN